MASELESQKESVKQMDERPQTPPVFYPEDEDKLVRKLDRRILPIACLLYLFACSSTVVLYALCPPF